jgi:hypothetical protein
MPRALNEPMGLTPSALRSRSGQPKAAPNRSGGSSGVLPCPSEMTCCQSGPEAAGPTATTPPARQRQRAIKRIAGAAKS